MNPDLYFRIQAHAAGAMKGAATHFNGQRHSLEIPEWGEHGADGPPLVVYWWPLTFTDKIILAEAERMDAGSPRSGYATLVSLVSQCARDEAGTKLFPGKDGTDLLVGAADARVVTRLAQAILKTAGFSADEAA